MLAWVFSAGIATRRLVVAFCVGAVLVGLAVRYPAAFHDANRIARANAALDLIDRDVGAGSSVFPDQSLLVEARGLIPAGESFAVDVGLPRRGWTALTADSAEPFLRSYLLPRRVDPAARWIVCVGCDRNAHADAEVAWKGDNGLSILRRTS